MQRVKGALRPVLLGPPLRSSLLLDQSRGFLRQDHTVKLS